VLAVSVHDVQNQRRSPAVDSIMGTVNPDH